MRQSHNQSKDTLALYNADWRPGMGVMTGSYLRDRFIQVPAEAPINGLPGSELQSPVYFGSSQIGSGGSLNALFTGPSIFNNSFNNPVDITMNPQFIQNQNTFINIDSGGGAGGAPGPTGAAGATGGTGPAGTATINIADGNNLPVVEGYTTNVETGFFVEGLVGGVSFTGAAITFSRKDLYIGLRTDVAGGVVTLTIKAELRPNTEDVLVIPVETCTTAQASTAGLILATTEDAILVGPNGTLAGPDGILLTDKDNSALVGNEYDVCLMSENGFVLTNDNGMILFNTTSATVDSIDTLLIGGDGDLLWDDNGVVLYGD